MIWNLFLTPIMRPVDIELSKEIVWSLSLQPEFQGEKIPPVRFSIYLYWLFLPSLFGPFLTKNRPLQPYPCLCHKQLTTEFPPLTSPWIDPPPTHNTTTDDPTLNKIPKMINHPKLLHQRGNAENKSPLPDFQQEGIHIQGVVKWDGKFPNCGEWRSLRFLEQQ